MKPLPLFILSVAVMAVFQNCDNFNAATITSNNSSGETNTDVPPDSDNSQSQPIELDPNSVLNYCPFQDDGSAPSDHNGRPVIRVCPRNDLRSGCDTSSLAVAISRAASGDRIEIVNSEYEECVVVPEDMNEIEIIGVCGRPHLRNSVCASKGYLVIRGQDISITNIEISGLSIPADQGGNAAAVRTDPTSNNLNLYGVYFHHNQNGVLGGKGVVNIDHSRFEANGSDQHVGYAHNIYMAPDVTELNIRNSIFLRARQQGNNLKTRSQKMLFECSVSASLDGVDSREMDISEGGQVRIINSVIQQGSSSQNSNIIGFATESNGTSRTHAINSLEISNSLFINDRTNGSFLSYQGYNNLTIIINNTDFVGPGTAISHSGGSATNITSSNFNMTGSRSDSGLSEVTNNHNDLPRPANCPSFNFY